MRESWPDWFDEKQMYWDWLAEQGQDRALSEEEPEENIPEAVMDRLPEPEEDTDGDSAQRGPLW